MSHDEPSVFLGVVALRSRSIADPCISYRDYLVIEGQGTIDVHVNPGSHLSISLYISSKNPACLRLDLTETGGKLFSVFPDGQELELDTKAPKGVDAGRLVPGVEDSYWLSLDKKNGHLRYGESYKCASGTCLVAKLDIGDEKTVPGPYIWVKKLRKFKIISPAAFGERLCQLDHNKRLLI